MFPFLLVRLQTLPGLGPVPQSLGAFPFLLVRLQTKLFKIVTQFGTDVSIPFSQAANVVWVAYKRHPYSRFHSFQLGCKLFPRHHQSGREPQVSIPFSQAANETIVRRMMIINQSFHSFQLGCKPESPSQVNWEEFISFHSFQLGCKLGYNLKKGYFHCWVSIPFSQAANSLKPILTNSSMIGFHSFQLGCKHWGRSRKSGGHNSVSIPFSQAANVNVKCPKCDDPSYHCFHSFQLGCKHILRSAGLESENPFPFLLVRLQTYSLVTRGLAQAEVSIPFSQAANQKHVAAFKSNGNWFPFLLVRLQTFLLASLFRRLNRVSIPFSQAANQLRSVNKLRK